MSVQLDVERAAVFCVGHLVCRGQLVRRRVGGQTVGKKLLMAGHKLRVGNVEVVVRADAVILQRIQTAAKLPLDHKRVQSRRAERLVEGCKLRCAHGLVQHLRDDLLLAYGEQRSIFLSSRCLSDGLEEDRQQLLLPRQRENGRPVHVFSGEIPAGNGSLGDMKELCFGGRQGHVRVPNPFSGFFDGVSDEQRCRADERAQRIADHVIHLRHTEGVAVLSVLNSRAEDAANKRCKDDSKPAVPLSRQGVGQCQPQREEEKDVHQHLAVKLWLLPRGGKGGEGCEDGLGNPRCAGQEGGVEDDERSHAGERGIEKYSPPFPDPLAEHGPEKEQGGHHQQQHFRWPGIDIIKHSAGSL